MSARRAPVRLLAAAIALGGALAAQGTGRVAVVSEHELEKAWLPGPEANRYVAGYPAAASDPSLDVCVAMGYLIGADGKTSGFVALKTWSSATPDAVPESKSVEPYVQTAASVVSMWRYLPAGSKPNPAYTSTVFAFPGKGAAPDSAQSLRARCRIDDLEDFIAQARNAAWLKQNRRGNDRVRKPHDMYDRHPDQRLGSDQ